MTPRPLQYLLVVALGAACAWAAPLHAADPPNIIFITIESLRADRVGCYGHERPTTPTLDRLADEGAVFEQCIAASNWTMPAQMTMFTGVYPSEHGAIDYRTRLADGTTTLAAELQQAGYQTAGVTSNPTCSRKFGFGRGFDHYDDFTVMMATELDLFEDEARDRPFHHRLTSKTVNRMALRWLTKTRVDDQPFFLHLFYFDPHYAYTPPPRYAAIFCDRDHDGKLDGTGIHGLRGEAGQRLTPADKGHIANLQRAEIRYTDEHIGRFLAQLDGLGLRDNTLVLVVGDHGEEFWDHGSVAHGHTLYDELVHVPLIVRWPGRIQPGTRHTQLVRQLDLMPFLLDAAGVGIPKQCRGRSLMPLLTGEGAWQPLPAFCEGRADRHVNAVRTGGMKIIRYVDTPKRAPLFFDLRQDPREQHDLAGTPAAERFKRLQKTFEAWEAHMRRAQQQNRREAQIDPALRKRLKALGYMQ